MEEKEFGWRPYDDEERADLAGQGFSDAEIAKMEAGNVYRPLPGSVLGIHFPLALLDVLAARDGPGIVHAFKAALQGRADRLATSDVLEDRVDAALVQDAINDRIDWEAFITRASVPKSPPGD